MKIFILLVFITNGSGASANFQEFNSKENCEIAGMEIQKKFSQWTRTVSYVCIEK